MGNSGNDCLGHGNTPTYQKLQTGYTWRQLALVCWQCRSIGYVHDNWDLFNLLIHQRLGRGYHPKPPKSALIVHPENIEARKVFINHHGFKVCTGACYIRSYIGDNKYMIDCLREITLTWEKKIGMISKTTGKYPQESYATVARMIQSEWIFLQRVTWDTGDVFVLVEKIIGETFLPYLSFWRKKTLSPIVGDLSTRSFKKSGLGLLNTVTPAKEKYLISQWGSA